MTAEEQRAWLDYELAHGGHALPVPDPDMWLALLFLLLEAWNELAWEIRQQLSTPAAPAAPRPLQRYRPGRHHLVADVKPVPDPMDAKHTAYLRAMAERMAHRYEIWS